ncbi:MAG: hypothetical protein H7A01_01100 [Hahellaceae bacterium]|nr:hypothetical protein [Hahellaceae bacterium]MCP5210899.1 hypothetical protein [Hahellaceae bacterium]
MSTPGNKKNNQKETAAASAPAPAHMDPQAQLREIQQLLFGEQIASVNQAIDSLSKHNQQQFADMDKQITHTINTLRQDMNNKLDELTKHVNKLNDERMNNDALIEGDVATLQQALDAFQQQTEAAHDTIEKQLFSEADKLATEMAAQHKSLLEKINAESGSLADSKTDRKALADLFVNMARSLEKEAS